MTNTQLQGFRMIAEQMNPGRKDWQWTGKWESQRMFGITKDRAQSYVKQYGGIASRMFCR